MHSDRSKGQCHAGHFDIEISCSDHQEWQKRQHVMQGVPKGGAMPAKGEAIYASKDEMCAIRTCDKGQRRCSMW